MKSALKKTYLIVFILFQFHFSVWMGKACASETHTEKDVIKPAYTTNKIEIDGIIEPAEWANAISIDNFTQTEPIEGEKPSKRTEVKLQYDKKNLYVAFLCEDEAEEIAHRIIHRDLESRSIEFQSDIVTLVLDTFHDHIRYYEFKVNPDNVQIDILDGDINWDAVWKSATKINHNGRADDGWIAEMAIPFKVLKFPNSPHQEWGIDFERRIQRFNEVDRWKSYTRDIGFIPPKEAGLLILSDVESGTNLEMLPAITFSPDQHSEDFPSLDIKYGLTNLTFDVTLNPNFAGVESDVAQIFQTRFERQFQEKRPFFVEGSDLFSIRHFQLFFSRRIGKELPDGQFAKILGGARVTGKIGRYNIGFLDVLTEKTEFQDSNGSMAVEPQANYSVVRIRRDILERSDVGLFYVEKNTLGADKDTRALGVDFRINPTNFISIEGQGAYAANDVTGGEDLAFRLRYAYRTDKFRWGVLYRNWGENFDINEIGFLPQNDRQRFSGWIGGISRFVGQ